MKFHKVIALVVSACVMYQTAYSATPAMIAKLREMKAAEKAAAAAAAAAPVQWPVAAAADEEGGAYGAPAVMAPAVAAAPPTAATARRAAARRPGAVAARGPAMAVTAPADAARYAESVARIHRDALIELLNARERVTAARRRAAEVAATGASAAELAAVNADVAAEEAVYAAAAASELRLKEAEEEAEAAAAAGEEGGVYGAPVAMAPAVAAAAPAVRRPVTAAAAAVGRRPSVAVVSGGGAYAAPAVRRAPVQSVDEMVRTLNSLPDDLRDESLDQMLAGSGSEEAVALREAVLARLAKPAAMASAVAAAAPVRLPAARRPVTAAAGGAGGGAAMAPAALASITGEAMLPARPFATANELTALLSKSPDAIGTAAAAVLSVAIKEIGKVEVRPERIRLADFRGFMSDRFTEALRKASNESVSLIEQQALSREDMIYMLSSQDSLEMRIVILSQVVYLITQLAGRIKGGKAPLTSPLFQAKLDSDKRQFTYFLGVLKKAQTLFTAYQTALRRNAGTMLADFIGRNMPAGLVAGEAEHIQQTVIAAEDSRIRKEGEKAAAVAAAEWERRAGAAAVAAGSARGRAPAAAVAGGVGGSGAGTWYSPAPAPAAAAAAGEEAGAGTTSSADEA